MWTEENVCLLITLYGQNPILWDFKHTDYKNRDKKNDALKGIAASLNMEVMEVERKISVILAQFRKNRRKVMKLKKSGLGPEEIGRSIWYGYHLMWYLEERFSTMRTSRSSGVQQVEHFIQENGTDDMDDGNSCISEETVEGHSTEFEQMCSNNGKRKVFTAPTMSKKQIVVKREEETSEMNESFEIAAPDLILTNEIGKDEYTLFGEQIALKLKKMDRLTRTETQHKISCIVYEAEMQMLHQGVATYSSSSFCETVQQPQDTSHNQ